MPQPGGMTHIHTLYSPHRHYTLRPQINSFTHKANDPHRNRLKLVQCFVFSLKLKTFQTEPFIKITGTFTVRIKLTCYNPAINKVFSLAHIQSVFSVNQLCIILLHLSEVVFADAQMLNTSKHMFRLIPSWRHLSGSDATATWFILLHNGRF